MQRSSCIWGLYTAHRIIILNRGSMFTFQWREFSPPLSSAHKLLQCYHRQKRDRRRCNSISAPRHYWAISQWARSFEWHHAVTLRILVGKNLHHFLPVLLRGMLPLFSIMTLWYSMLWYSLLSVFDKNSCLNIQVFFILLLCQDLSFEILNCQFILYTLYIVSYHAGAVLIVCEVRLLLVDICEVSTPCEMKSINGKELKLSNKNTTVLNFFAALKWKTTYREVMTILITLSFW